MASRGTRLKFAIGDTVSVNARGSRWLRGRTGLVREVGPTKGEYRVEFDDGRLPSFAYLEAFKLDRTQPR